MSEAHLTDTAGKPGFTKEKKPGVADVARLAGVSSTVVYTFIKGNYYKSGGEPGGRVGISEETRERIVRAMDAVGYTPPDAASVVRIRRRAGGFLMMLSDSIRDGVGNPYFGRIFQGLSSEGGRDGRSVSLTSFDQKTDYLAHPEKLPDAVRRGLINKVLLAGDPNYSLIFSLKKAGCAVIYASRDLGSPDIPGVLPDYRKAARLAIEHLTSQGHRRIALAVGTYANPDATYFKELTAGSLETWEALRFAEPPPQYVPPPESGLASAYLTSIFEKVPGVTAIFCFDDFVAISLTNACLARGLFVPGNISIMGCNDEARPYVNIPLSTIRIPKMRIGQMAAKMLDDYIRLGPAQPPVSCILPVELKVRETTGPLVAQ